MLTQGGCLQVSRDGQYALVQYNYVIEGIESMKIRVKIMVGLKTLCLVFIGH